MLKTRILTALALLLPLVVGVWYWPASFWPLAALLTFFCGAAHFEWLRLLKLPVPKALGVVLVCTALMAWLGRSGIAERLLHPPYALAVLAVLGLGWWWLMARCLIARQGHAQLMHPLWGGLLAALACWAAMACVLGLMRFNLELLLNTLLVVWIADIAAYASGRLFGRHKLAPSISPGKTWEGVLGGCVATALFAALVPVTLAQPATAWSLSWFSNPDVHAWQRALMVLPLTATSVMGDLFESQLKRLAGVKDSGKLLPGHGGVLDRIDALLPTLPVSLLLNQLWLALR